MRLKLNSLYISDNYKLAPLLIVAMDGSPTTDIQPTSVQLLAETNEMDKITGRKSEY